MHGFLKYITSNSQTAISLREKIIFKIIPMINPDGVIVGNYRTWIWGIIILGSDLNRWFTNPDPTIHPWICAIKEIVSEIYRNYWVKKNPIIGYFDLHAHYKKKCVFLYGPYYPLHD